MGAVYRGLDVDDSRPVAIKQLLDPRHAGRFEIEARLLSQLEHPRVVRVVDHFGGEESSYYLVMELVDGPDLNEVLSERGDPGLPCDEAIDYTLQACEALQYVHDQSVVHRDVKPHNLILGDSGVVLVDFGIARELGAERGTVAIGTPQYMAPEVFSRGAVSARSDVFSLAATLWTLLTGSPPEYGGRGSPSDTVEGVSPGLTAALRDALEVDPDSRTPSVPAFARALGSTLARSEGASLALSVERPAGPRTMLEAIVRTAAGVFDAASASIAITDPRTGELFYEAAWGAGAEEIVGVRLPAGVGIAGSVVSSGVGLAVPDCRGDSRFASEVAEATGYVPHTMVVVPLKGRGRVMGALAVLDRRDGSSFDTPDVRRAELFADLAVKTISFATGTGTGSGTDQRSGTEPPPSGDEEPEPTVGPTRVE